MDVSITNSVALVVVSEAAAASHFAAGFVLAVVFSLVGLAFRVVHRGITSGGSRWGVE